MCIDIEDDAPARQDRTYLWRDLLKVHSAFPLHCLVGGGDQVYNDGVWRECAGLKAWGEIDLLYVQYCSWMCIAKSPLYLFFLSFFFVHGITTIITRSVTLEVSSFLSL